MPGSAKHPRILRSKHTDSNFGFSLAASGISTSRENLRFKLLQGTPTPMNGKVLRLDRSPIPQQEEHGAEAAPSVDIDAEMAILQKIIQRMKKDSGQKGSDMDEAMTMVFAESLNLESKHGVCFKVAQQIQAGHSCRRSFEIVRPALEEIFKRVGMGVAIVDFLNAFGVNLDEVSESRKSIKSVLKNSEGPTIIFTETVIPADFVEILKHNEAHPESPIVGFVRNNGTPNDHIETLCQQYGLGSAIMQDTEFDFSRVKNKSLALIMSEEGRGEGRDLIFNPAPELFTQYENEVVVFGKMNEGLPLSYHAPYTKCGEEVKLTYAISNLSHVPKGYERLDVGLVRAELISGDQSEATFTEAYKKILLLISPGKAVMRMPDNVGDKVDHLADVENIVTTIEDVDGTRPLTGDEMLLYNHEALFRPCARAILSAAAENPNASILFPQVTNGVNAQRLVDYVHEEQRDLGIADLQIPIGMMIEGTRASRDLENIVAVPGVKFISLGSNDFTSDVLGINRYDKTEYDGYSMCHTDVIRALDEFMRRVDDINANRSAEQGKLKVSICGNMTNPIFIPILIGLGFREFCVEGKVEVANKIVNMCDVEECKQLVQDILQHRMKPGESVYHEFLLPFLNKLSYSPLVQKVVDARKADK